MTLTPMTLGTSDRKRQHFRTETPAFQSENASTSEQKTPAL